MAYQGNPLYRDRDITTIAKYLQVAPDIIREHIKRYSTIRTNDVSNKSQPKNITQVESSARLAAVWTKLNEESIPESISHYISEATGCHYKNREEFLIEYQLQNQDNHLSYSAWYSDHPPNEVASKAVQQYCMETIISQKNKTISNTKMTDLEKLEEIKKLLAYEHYIESKPYAYQT